MEKVIELNKNNLSLFYKRIYLLKVLSFFCINIKIQYEGKEYQNSSLKHPKELDEILKILDIINTHHRKDKYSLIYDYACDYLDNEFISGNWCNFNNNKCVYNRTKPKSVQVNSCCTRNYNKELCKYFDNKEKSCSIKCLSCKLFVCPYLEKKGIKCSIKKTPYLHYFLSLRQKQISKINFFKPKGVFIKKWLRWYYWI